MKTIKNFPEMNTQQLNILTKEQLIFLLQAQSSTIQIQSDTIQTQTNSIGELDKRIELLTEELNLMKHRYFGRSSEKHCDGQLSMFNEAEATATAESDEENAEEETISCKRKKSKKSKQMDLSQFPVVRIEHNLTEEERICDECGKALKVVSTEVSRRLRFIPARFEVEEHVTYIYACVDSACGQMVRPQKDAPLLKGSLATGSLVAAIMNAKYFNGLPLYRIEKDFKYNGLELSRKRMSHWLVRCTQEYLSLVYDALAKHFLPCQYKQADETRVQVLHEDGREATTNSYMWLYRTGELCETPPIILYRYEMTRAGHHPKTFLGEQSCYLTTDGYQAYHGLSNEITVTGCWAHARRKFDEILKSLPQEQQRKTVAFEALERISALYEIEKRYRIKTPEERLLARQKESKPLVEAFFAWLEPMSLAADAQSAIGKAINYALNQQQYLEKFLQDGRVPIDNNASERAIKLFVMGRKAWLFCNTPSDAESSAIIYSIVETAKANGCIPYAYLRHLLDTIPNHLQDTSLCFLEDLLPWSPALPISCKVIQPES